MKTYIPNKVVLASLLLIMCFTGKGQNNTGTYTKVISIMLPDKADLDCMQTELLQNMKGISLIYANPYTGLMMLKSELQDKKSLLETLSNCILTKNEKIKFEVIETTATYYLSSK